GWQGARPSSARAGALPAHGPLGDFLVLDARLERRSREPGDGANLLHAAERWVLHLNYFGVVDDLGVGERLLGAAEGLGGDVADRQEAGHPFVEGALLDAREEVGLEAILVFRVGDAA